MKENEPCIELNFDLSKSTTKRYISTEERGRECFVNDELVWRIKDGVKEVFKDGVVIERIEGVKEIW